MMILTVVAVLCVSSFAAGFVFGGAYSGYWKGYSDGQLTPKANRLGLGKF